MNPRFRRHGFTLIELLVALAIFAILSLISFRTLSSIFDTRERLATETAKLRDVSLLFARIEADLGGLLNRNVRDVNGLIAPPLQLVAQPATPDDPAIAFTRVGFADAEGSNAAPQRIAYRFKEGRLELMLWPGLDQAPRTTPVVYTALAHLRDVRWRARSLNGTDLPDWPMAGNTAERYPTALELTLTLEDGMEVRRLFALRPLS
jgi:general secretion pathway protein J